MEDNRLNTIQFAQSLFLLEPDTPIASEFDTKFGQTAGRWWSCQREHFTTWAIFQDSYGVGEYTHKPNTNAKKMYYGIGRPELLLWLIEALHISLKLESDLEVFKKFVVELSKLGRNPRKQCSLIREKYPYDVIEGWLCLHRKKIRINVTK